MILPFGREECSGLGTHQSRSAKLVKFNRNRWRVSHSSLSASASATVRFRSRESKTECFSKNVFDASPSFGVWEQLQQCGLKVPDDIALIGFGDLPDAQRRNPPLTTVRIEYVELGRQLASMAIRKAANPRVALAETVLPTRLILRGTTWPISMETVGAEGGAASR